MVSTRPTTSKSSRLFNNPLVTVPKAPITIGVIVTFMFHSFFNSLARSRYLSFFSHSFSFILWSARTAKSTIWQVLFIIIIIPCEFFTAALTGGLSLKSYWQQILLGLQNYSEYSSQSLWCLSFLFSKRDNNISTSCFTAFSALWQDPSICLYFRFLLFSLR